jgi:hypothetical protein
MAARRGPVNPFIARHITKGGWEMGERKRKKKERKKKRKEERLGWGAKTKTKKKRKKERKRKRKKLVAEEATNTKICRLHGKVGYTARIGLDGIVSLPLYLPLPLPPFLSCSP